MVSPSPFDEVATLGQAAAVLACDLQEWLASEPEHRALGRERCIARLIERTKLSAEAATRVFEESASDVTGFALRQLYLVEEASDLSSFEVYLRLIAIDTNDRDPLAIGLTRAKVATQLKRIGVPEPTRLAATTCGRVSDLPALATKGDDSLDLGIEEPEPWDEPVDGVKLLDDIATIVQRHIVMAAESVLVVALWVLHTYAIDAADATPYLAVTSPEKRCGKTNLLTVLWVLAHRAIKAANISTASIYRVIEAVHPTLFIDEAETFLREESEMRGVLNAGNQRDEYVIRCDGDDNKPRAFDVFCPKTFGAIGRIPSTLEDRSIAVRMERCTKEERKKAGIVRIRRRNLRGQHETIRRRCARWAADNLEVLGAYEPAVPGELNDRASEAWLPLLAIADVVGGDWPDRARRAARHISGDGSAQDPADEGPGNLLLGDIRDMFADGTLVGGHEGGDAVHTAELLQALLKLPERPWSEYRRGEGLNDRGIAKLLRPYGVRSKQVRIGERNAKGYERAALERAWMRYLPRANDHEEGGGATESETTKHLRDDGGFRRDPLRNSAPAVSEPRDRKGSQDQACIGVSVQDPLPTPEATEDNDPDLFEVSVEVPS